MLILTITNSDRTFKKEFTDNLIPKVCLEVAGGGYTVKQTAKAMLLQNKLLTTGKAIYKNISMEIK
jgi:hypothetical protein